MAHSTQAVPKFSVGDRVVTCNYGPGVVTWINPSAKFDVDAWTTPSYHVRVDGDGKERSQLEMDLTPEPAIEQASAGIATSKIGECDA